MLRRSDLLRSAVPAIILFSLATVAPSFAQETTTAGSTEAQNLPGETAATDKQGDIVSGRAKTSPEAEQRSDAIFAQIKKLEAAQDMQSAANTAGDASRQFAAEGERYLAASYRLMKSEYEADLGKWQQIDADLLGEKDSILADLDAEDASRADNLLLLLMDTQGYLGRRGQQAYFADQLRERIRQRHGDLSEQDLQVRIRSAYSLLQTGADEEGYKSLKSALRAADTTKQYELTISTYVQAGKKYMDAGQLDKAEDLFTAGLASQAARFDTVDLPNLMAFDARVKSDTGRLPEATEEFERATIVAERIFGKASEGYILVRDEYAAALARNGFPASSTTMMGKNYQLALKTYGPDFNWTWKTANNYADQLRMIGAPRRAIELDAFLLEKRAAYYGADHFNVFVSANNMAQNYLALGRYDEARKYLEQQRGIGEALSRARPGSDFVTQVDGWIELCDAMSGRLPANADTAATIEAIIPSSDYAELLRIEAASFAATQRENAGDRAGGLRLRETALQISQKLNGPTHPQTFDLRLDIARAKSDIDAADAAGDFMALDQDMRRWMAREIGTAGDRAVAEAVRALADDMLHDYAALAVDDQTIVPAFTDAIVRWRSIDDGKRERLRQVAIAVPRSDTETHRMIDEGLRLNGEIRELLSAGDADDLAQSITERLRDLDDALNARLAQIPGLDADRLPALPTPADLVGKDGAFVNYFVARRWKGDRQSADPYEDIVLYAAVICGGQEPRLVALGDPRSGEAMAAQTQLASLRQTRGATPLADIAAPLDGTYDRVLKPLEPMLSDIRTLYILPDGPLFAIPFSLMRDGEGRSIEDRYEVRLLTRPEALFALNDRETVSRDTHAVLAGGLDYVRGAEKGAVPLPGTAAEVDSIASALRGHVASVDVLRGPEATEKAVRERIASAQLLHLATHGTYGSEASGGADGVDTLWQSGIVLSKSGDARTRARNDNDNFLYAFEIMDWDLSKVDLLVLSACETGRGDESFVDGLRGLPTAIGVAGAKRSLLTLWPVDDLGTAAFIDRFYKHLAGGMTYFDALRQTRRDAIAGEVAGAQDPLVWAAFVMFEN